MELDIHFIASCHIDAGRRLSVEKVKYPNPRCGRRIPDIEEMPSGETVMEAKSIKNDKQKRYIHFCGRVAFHDKCRLQFVLFLYVMIG